MNEASVRLGLPLMAAGQAQKEVTHNEALMLIDSLIAPVSEAPPQNEPPVSPNAGQCWLVGGAPTGEWTGQAHRLAAWSQSGWRFADLPVGAHVRLATNGQSWVRIPAGWQSPPTVTLGNSGNVVDNECRAATSAILAALVSAGLIVGG